MKMQIKRVVGASLASLGMVVGLAGFAGAQSGMGSIDTTGPNSHNVVSQYTSRRVHVNNDNDVSAWNNNHQAAMTGDAGAYHNTTAGGTTTGSASNANALNASATIDNSASSTAAATMPASSGDNSGSISTTGVDSYNRVSSVDTTHVTVNNDNDLHVANNNSQWASSGDATVAGNTTGGSATTGDASNANTTTISFKVSN
jgi:hypothetical protein